MCACLADHVSNESALVAVEIVHDDHVAGLQRWQQDLFNIGFEAVAVDWAADGEWSRHAVKSEGSNEGYASASLPSSGQTSPCTGEPGPSGTSP